LVPGPEDLAEDAAHGDERWMALALDEARAAARAGEVPIGAVVVHAGEPLARARNRVRELCDPAAHAELLALRDAARLLGVVRLTECAVYSTVEPCFMCAGALVHARVLRVVWGVRDPKFGGCASLGNVLDHPAANHRVAWREGVLADEARTLLQEFFRARRKDQE
jgi:tRNA(adenine34) deaminase